MTSTKVQTNEIVGRLVRRLLGPVGVVLGPPASSFYAADLRDGQRAPTGVDVPIGTRLLVVEPVRSVDGLPMASIVVADGSPRQLSPRDREALRDIAVLASGALSRRTDAEREQAQRSERLLELSQEGFALAERGILLDVSPALARMFGAEAHALVGRSVLELVLPEQHDEFMRVMTSGQTGSLETMGVRADRRVFAVEVSHRCLTGEMLCTLNFRDLTQQRLRERQRSEFFTGMGHELRTPLGSLRAALGLLRRRGLNDEARALVQIAQNHAEGLARLVSDLVDHESILSGRVLLTLVPVDALTLVEQAVRVAQTRAPEREVGVALDHALGGRRVQADAMRLGQALTIVLDHCVYAAPKGSLVEVWAGVEDERLVIHLDCATPPIEPLSRIFDPFSGGDSAPEAGRGHLRLGMSLARAILLRHGGELEAGANGRGGTRFVARLEVWREPPQLVESPPDARADALVLGQDAALLALLLREGEVSARAPGPAENLEDALRQSGAQLLVLTEQARPPAQLPPGVTTLVASADPQVLVAEARAHLRRRAPSDGVPRVLYVEDDADHAELMVAILAGVARTECVSTLAEARRMLAERSYRVVLTDIGLPDGSGLELVKELVEMGSLAPRVIVFSARTLEVALPESVRVLMKASVNNDELRAAVLSMV